MNQFINIHFEAEDTPSTSSIILNKAGFYEKVSDHQIYRHPECQNNDRNKKASYHWYEASHSSPDHTALINEAIFIYCLEGSGWLKSSETEWAVEKGTAIFCDQNVVHAYGSNPFNPWTIIWVHFNGTLVKDMTNFLHCDHSCITFNMINEIDCRPLLARMMTLLQIDAHLHRALATHYLEIALSEIMLHPLKHSLNPSSANILSQPVLESLSYMNTQLSSHMTLAQLANHANLSKYHFARQFKQATGQAPMTYFNHLKILKASELLRTTSLRILDISTQLGFSSPYYFSETFKQFMHLSPSAYKQKQGIKY